LQFNDAGKHGLIMTGYADYFPFKSRNHTASANPAALPESGSFLMQYQKHKDGGFLAVHVADLCRLVRFAITVNTA